MLNFNALRRWRPEVLLAVADRLESGHQVKALGHLYRVEPVIIALRHAAMQVQAARIDARAGSDQVFGRG